MAILPALKELLEMKGVLYEVHPHPVAYTAQEVAHAQHVKGRVVAKTVVLHADDRYVLAVLPAPFQVDLDRARAVLGAKAVRLAREEEMAPLFPGCEVGAEPPLGDLFSLPVLADERLAADPAVYFSAGNHGESVKISWADYVSLARPKIADFARRPA